MQSFKDYGSCNSKCDCIVQREYNCTDILAVETSKLRFAKLDQTNILYGVTHKQLYNDQFHKYFDKVASYGPIKDEIRPEDGTEFVFMGCGRVDSDAFDVGIIATPDKPFQQKSILMGAMEEQLHTKIISFIIRRRQTSLLDFLRM